MARALLSFGSHRLQVVPDQVGNAVFSNVHGLEKREECWIANITCERPRQEGMLSASVPYQSKGQGSVV